jgi:hypothetical protein
VITVLAETLALALVLASPGTPPAKAALELQPDNAARARRGLLPRKVTRARSPSRARRMVLVPKAPTWLGEPGAPVEPAPEYFAEPAVAGEEPRSGRVVPVVAAVEREEAAPLRVAVDAVAVQLLLVRHRGEASRPAVRATLGAAEIEAVVIRREAPLAW